MVDTAAGIIDLDIGTRVITVGAGGFDTNADQPQRTAPPVCTAAPLATAPALAAAQEAIPAARDG